MNIDFRALWDDALPYDRFVQQSETNRDLWTGMYRLARIPEWAIAAACRTTSRLRLLVLAEDWCGDGSSTVPYLAKLADQADCLKLRILRRDAHPEVMDRYLTAGSRAIPIVIVLDEDFHEVGHWGPRPAALQRWVLEAGQTLPKEQLRLETRRWYARDKGESTLREVLGLIQRQPSAVGG